MQQNREGGKFSIKRRMNCNFKQGLNHSFFLQKKEGKILLFQEVPKCQEKKLQKLGLLSSVQEKLAHAHI